MSKDDFFHLPLWDRYSKKMTAKIASLRSCGFFTKEVAETKKMRCVKAKGGIAENGNVIAFYFLIDENDGVICDAKYQLFSDSAMLTMLEILTPFMIGKTYEQIRHISKDLLIKQLSEEKENYLFPDELASHILIIQEALQEASKQCGDIKLEIRSPLPHEEREKGAGYPGFLSLTKEQKIAVIEEVIEKEIRPYVALDEGGVRILDLIDDELSIAYEGNCTSCFSSVGATLSAIQDILREKVSDSLTVVPNMDNFKF